MTTRMTRICLLLRSNSNTKHKEKLVKNIPHVTLHCCLHKTQSTATQIQIRSLLQFWVFLTLLATSSSRGSFTKKSLKLVVKYFKIPNYKKCIDCTYQKKIRTLVLCKYLITLQHLLNLHKGKLHTKKFVKKDNFTLLN